MIAGSNCGVRPTATASEKMKASRTGRWKVDVDREDGDDEHQRDLHQEVPEAPDAPFELRFRRAEPQPLGHLAELGRRPGADHGGRGAAAHHVRAHEERVGPLPERHIRRDGPRLLLDRVRLPGQRRLVEEEVVRLEHQAVSRDALAGGQDHDIARDDLRDGDLLLCTVPQRRRPGLHDGEQLVHRVSRAAFLPEPQHAAGQDDAEDDERVGGVVQEEGQAGREEEDQDERALELAEQEADLPRSLPRLQDVGADPLEPPGGLGAGQAPGGRIEPPEHVGGGKAPEAVESVAHALHTQSRISGGSSKCARA